MTIIIIIIIRGGAPHDTPAEEAAPVGEEVMRRSIARVGPGRVKSPVGTHTEGFRPPYLLGRCCYLRARNAATVRLLITDLRRLDIRLGAWQLHVTVLKIREHRERNRRLLVAASVCMDAPSPHDSGRPRVHHDPGIPDGQRRPEGHGQKRHLG